MMVTKVDEAAALRMLGPVCVEVRQPDGSWLAVTDPEPLDPSDPPSWTNTEPDTVECRWAIRRDGVPLRRLHPLMLRPGDSVQLMLDQVELT